jgi:hypothetical protein
MAALSPNYRVGTNLLRTVFLDPAERELRRDWETLTEEAVAVLRANAGTDLANPRLVELVDGLSAESERFRLLWSRHDVQPKLSHISHLRHPLVGDLDLVSDKLVIAGTDGLMLVLFHAAPGSRNVELLASLVDSLASR